MSVLGWLPASQAAEAISPAVMQRLVAIMGRAEEDPQRALDELQQLAARRRTGSADLAAILHERAALLVQQDQTALAREELEAAFIDQPPEFGIRLRYLLAQILLIEDQPEAALSHLEVWHAQQDEPSPAGLYLMGHAYLRLDRFDEAAVVLEQAVATTDVPQYQWVEMLAYTYSRVGRAAEATALLEDIIAEQPANARWWRQLASVYLLLDDVPTGTAAFAIAGLVDTMAYDDARQLARLFGFLGMPEDGARILSRAMTAAEGVSFEDRMLLAELWMMAREFDAAIGAFQEAAMSSDSNGEPGMMMAQLYLQREDYENARVALTDAIQRWGEATPSQAWYLLAVVELNRDDHQAAARALERLQDDSSYRERVQRLEAYLRETAAPSP
jgi:predicted Zn-dependent protease